MDYLTLDKSKKTSRSYHMPRNLDDLLKLNNSSRSLIFSGMQLSFAPCFADETSEQICMKNLNSIIDFDQQNMIVNVESGITLYDLNKFLYKNGYIIYLTPGWPTVTIGGCIANNIHGKNPNLQGIFGDLVVEIKLLTPDNHILTLNQFENTELFNFTKGGYGLTGAILSAKIKVQNISNSFLIEKKTVVKDIYHSYSIIKKSNSKIGSYSWHSFSDKNKFGMGINFDYYEPLAEKKIIIKNNYLKVLDIKKLNQPINFFNKFTIQLMNKWFFYKHTKSLQNNIPIFNFLYPMALFPINLWFFLNGRKGFIEHQVIIPEKLIEYYIENLTRIIKDNKIIVYSVLVKLFNGEKKKLDFNNKGLCVSLAILNDYENRIKLKKIDELNDKTGTITALYKDSRLSLQSIKNQYGQGYNDFICFLKNYDKSNKIQSYFKSTLFNF